MLHKPRTMLPYVLLLSRPSLIIGYDAERDWLYTDWRGPQNQETVQQGCEQMVIFLRAMGSCKILNDNTNVTVPWIEQGSVWVMDYLLPRLQAAGLHYLAWVYGPTHESWRSVNMTLALALAKTDMELEAFPDVASACTWLLTKHCPAHDSHARPKATQPPLT